MDIVGPLPRSSSGKRFILVICDYATHYPEAVALRTIDANQITEELISFFARVGIPEEILTDQGTNFTSQPMQEVYRLLQIKPIRTTPYHPQMDGLVERFNHTLKSMLKKARTGTSCSHIYFLPTEKFPKRQRAYPHLNWSTADRSEDHWTSSEKPGSHTQAVLKAPPAHARTPVQTTRPGKDKPGAVTSRTEDLVRPKCP